MFLLYNNWQVEHPFASAYAESIAGTLTFGFAQNFQSTLRSGSSTGPFFMVKNILDKVMSIVHTFAMNYQRVTVNIPKNVYDDLLALYGKGKISEAMSEAAERQVLKKKLEPKDPIKAFLAHREKLPKLTTKQILDAIHKGRT